MLEKDCITGLPTLSSIPDFFEQFKIDHKTFAVLLLDIDRFILFNDRYGHQIGDKKLKQIANIIINVVPKDSNTFRSGGDEFSILLPLISMVEVVFVAIKLKEEIDRQFSKLDCFQHSYIFSDRSILSFNAHLTISGGIVFYPQCGNNYTILREKAHDLMHQNGKGFNKNGVLSIAL